MDWHGVLDRGHFSAVVGKAYKEYKRTRKWLSFIRFARHGRKYNTLFKRYNRGLIPSQEFWGNVYKDLGVKSANIFEELVSNYTPLDEGWELLDDILKNSLPVYIFSDCPEDKMEVIKSLSEVKVFEKMFFSCEYGVMKNENEFFEIFVEDTGLGVDEFVFLDDNPINVRKARQNGWQAFTFAPKNLEKIREFIGL